MDAPSRLETHPSSPDGLFADDANRDRPGKNSIDLEPPSADESWDEHYRDERDAAYLYRSLAAVERVPKLAELFEKLAVVEDRHVQRWEELFQSSGRSLPEYRTAGRTRLLAWSARRFGTSLVLPMMLAEEGREVQAYLGLARRSDHGQTHAAALEIATDSAIHARELASTTA
jgi:rubrerythrin